MIVFVVILLTIVLHMIYWRLIRHKVPHRTPQQAFVAWAVCFIIALLIYGGL